jgi:hypothetical protein
MCAEVNSGGQSSAATLRLAVETRMVVNVVTQVALYQIGTELEAGEQPFIHKEVLQSVRCAAALAEQICAALAGRICAAKRRICAALAGGLPPPNGGLSPSPLGSASTKCS